MQTKEEEVRFIRNPDRWPCWPLLPMKSLKEKGDGNMPQLGYMYYPRLVGNDVKPVIYLGSLYRANPRMDEKKEYDSLDALLEEWEID